VKMRKSKKANSTPEGVFPRGWESAPPNLSKHMGPRNGKPLHSRYQDGQNGSAASDGNIICRRKS
jgi:hypothetical protein